MTVASQRDPVSARPAGVEIRQKEARDRICRILVVCLKPYLLVSLSPLWLVSASPAAGLEQKQGKAGFRVEAGKIEDGRPEIRLSDKLTLIFHIDGRPTVEVQPLEKVSASPDWEVHRKSNPRKEALGDGRVRWQQTIVLNPLNTGDVLLPLEPLLYREDPDSMVWEKADWKPISVRVNTEILEPDLGELRNVTPPEQLPPVSLWRVPVAWAAWPLAFACLFLGGAYYLRRARRKPALPPHKWALGELDRIGSLPLSSQADIEQFHLLLSDVIRRYLELRFQLPAPERTTAEFVAEMQKSSQLNDAQQNMLRELLERCDLAKFARIRPPSQECHIVATMARTLVEQSAGQDRPEASSANTDKNRQWTTP